MNIPYVFKKCSKCGRWLVANSVNFYKNKTKKDGLSSNCKDCERKQNKNYYEQNKDKVKERAKNYYEQNKDEVKERVKNYYEQNKEKILAQQKEYYEQNKDKVLVQHKEWHKQNKDKHNEWKKEYYKQNKDKYNEWKKEYYEQNKEKILARNKEYYEQNKDKILAHHKEYGEQNKNKISAYNKEYLQTPRGQVVAFNHHHKRRTQKQTQGNGITTDQWQEVMNYFDWKCAYSGETLTKDTRSLDHIEPLDKGGEHEIWNVVPMTRSLNSSKQDKDMLEWYKQQDFYSEERLAKIREWQEYAYQKYYLGEVEEYETKQI